MIEEMQTLILKIKNMEQEKINNIIYYENHKRISYQFDDFELDP